MRSILLVVLTLVSVGFGYDLKIPVTFDSLPNGLKVIIVPDSNVAVVSCRLYYFVGSMYEGTGTSGLSHMYEHMMFKGTKRLGTTSYEKEVPIMKKIDSLEKSIVQLKDEKNRSADSLQKSHRAQIGQLLEKQRAFIKKDEIWELYQNSGATNLNAWTSDDMTAYIVTLPKNKVELFYWIESDRMRDPVLREFFSERDVILEERRMRVDNRPINKYWERLNALFYIAHPYRIPTIGWQSDIESYTREKMADHVNKFYTPDNALLVLVGNINPQKAFASIKKYFGPIPRAKKPVEEIVTREPQPIGDVVFTVYDNVEPRIDMLFPTPGYPNDTLFRLDIAEQILSGRSGRLYRRLVDKEGLCTDAGAENNIRLHNGYFHIWAELKSQANPEKVRDAIQEELQKLFTNPPSKNEMTRTNNELRMNFIAGLKSLEGLSDRLAWFERLGNWQDLLTYPDKISAVKAEEIPAVLSKYLNSERMTLGQLLKKPTKEK